MAERISVEKIQSAVGKAVQDALKESIMRHGPITAALSRRLPRPEGGAGDRRCDRESGGSPRRPSSCRDRFPWRRGARRRPPHTE